MRKLLCLLFRAPRRLLLLHRPRPRLAHLPLHLRRRLSRPGLPRRPPHCPCHSA
nr:MAG TPA: hypothetical protein [Caudoviricetes sp.]